MADDRPLNGEVVAPRPLHDARGKFAPGHVRVGGIRRGTQHRMTKRLYGLIDDELERRGLTAIRNLDDADLLKLAALCRIKDEAPDHEDNALPPVKSTAELHQHIRDKYG